MRAKLLARPKTFRKNTKLPHVFKLSRGLTGILHAISVLLQFQIVQCMRSGKLILAWNIFHIKLQFNKCFEYFVAFVLAGGEPSSATGCSFRFVLYH